MINQPPSGEDEKGTSPTMHEPATYRIRVRGRLGPDWSDRVGGMEITEAGGPKGDTQTILSGRLADQSSLAGVLNTLHDLQLPVISVECLANGTEDGDSGPQSRPGLPIGGG